MSCPLCRDDRRRKLYDLAKEDGLAFATSRCVACGFVYMYPRPTEAYLSDYYGRATVYAAVSDRPDDYANVMADKRNLISRMLALAPGAVTSGLAVDYGAGNGATVKVLLDLGFDAVGVEISERARETARALFDVDMRGGDLADFADGSIQLLTMFDILEHLLEPRDFVDQCLRKLAPGGVLLVVVPNFDAIDRILTGAASKALIFPEHVNQFTRSSLLRLMKGAGLSVRYVGSPPPYGVALTMGLRRGLLNVFGRHAWTLMLRDALVALKRHVVYPLPNAFVERTGLLGQSLLIVAQKG